MTAPGKRRTAVALQYDGGEAPRVTARGRGAVAENIIDLAREHGIAVEENAGLAEALSTIELDQEIPIELYEAVARVISFVMRAGKA
jgi:flagellar biosynthesis protein